MAIVLIKTPPEIGSEVPVDFKIDSRVIPRYSSDKFGTFLEDMGIIIPLGLSKVMDGTEPPPSEFDTTGFSAQELIDFAAYKKRYIERDSLLYKYFHLSNISTVGAERDAMADAFMRKNMHSGRATVLALKEFHNNPSDQSKWIVVKELLRLHKKVEEKCPEFKLRVEKVFARIAELKFTFNDLQLVTFLNGLGPEYNTVVAALLMKNNLTMDEVTSALDSHDKFHRQQTDTAASYSALSSSSSVVTEELLDKVAKNAVALYVSSTDKHGGGGKKSGKMLFKRSDYNVKDFPDTPTPYEKQLTCNTCSLLGHASRTCKVVSSKKRGREED
jgi:hypothetical protein